MGDPMTEPVSYWAVGTDQLAAELGSTVRGLTRSEAARRRKLSRSNQPKPHIILSKARLLCHQFESPIILILLFASCLSYFLHSPVDATVIVAIVLVSGLLGFWQENAATNAVGKLLALVHVQAVVLRDNETTSAPIEEIVPGDVVMLSAGSSMPGDCILLESQDLYVNEAALTGETYPVEKMCGVLPEPTPLNSRTNTLFLGTHVVSGSATALVVHTGTGTEFGKISSRLRTKPPETEFERGVRRFGALLGQVTMLLVLCIFAVNVFLKRPVIDSFLFALALAVGLTPQLLPAIISINLAHGARRMAKEKVIVKRLAAIEDFGSMNVLCSDKTGTLTEGTVRLQEALDWQGKPSDKVLLHAFLNANFETGFKNPIDEAIRASASIDISQYRKLDEVPYDFLRKRLSVCFTDGSSRVLVTKGALANVLNVCETVETSNGLVAVDELRGDIDQLFHELSGQGFRTLGVAYRLVSESGQDPMTTPGCEANMTFLGFLTFADAVKKDVPDTVRALAKLGVTLKMITGDNRLVAAQIGEGIGLQNPKVLTGTEVNRMSDEALLHRVQKTEIFAEIEPNQKERIILALRKAGNVVGYMGDGINDASGLHAADVGISVASAVDVAKESADIILLEQDLGVLAEGIREGRVTFANTLKYVFMATSANFGNMFSMAGASLFLPFLPLLPKQILLTNLLTDLPEMAIATDAVDAEAVQQPRRWDVAYIRRFMLTFGLLSSIFDYLTFAVLRLLLHAGPTEFRTGWFIESVISASVIVLVIRTRCYFFQSRPAPLLAGATALVACCTLLLPFTPLAAVFGFGQIPPAFYGVVVTITGAYVLVAEAAKTIFYRRL